MRVDPLVWLTLLALGPVLPVAASVSPGEIARLQALAAPLVEAINTEDPALRLAAVRRLYTAEMVTKVGAERLAAQLAGVKERIGPLTLGQVRVAVWHSGPVLHVVAEGRGRWHDLQLYAQAEPPALRQLVFIAEATAPVELPAGDILDAKARAWLDAQVTRLATTEELSGVLLIAQGERVLLQRAFGFRDPARREPIGPDTRFNLASGNKMFTALALARLAEQGRLDLDAPLGRLLPGLGLDADGRRATPRQLISHTAGFGEYWDADFERARLAAQGPLELLPRALAAPRAFAPGTRFGYSNSNFVLAGEVAHLITDRSHADLVDELVLKPAGMQASGFFAADELPADSARPLLGEPGAWRAAPLAGHGSAAGGAWSTAPDMLRFVRALRGGRIVKSATLSRMTRAANSGLPDGAGFAYGEGFQVANPGQPAYWGHGGTAPGVSFELRHHPDADLTLIVFSNHGNGAYDDLRRISAELVERAARR